MASASGKRPPPISPDERHLKRAATVSEDSDDSHELPDWGDIESEESDHELQGGAQLQKQLQYRVFNEGAYKQLLNASMKQR